MASPSSTAALPRRSSLEVCLCSEDVRRLVKDFLPHGGLVGTMRRVHSALKTWTVSMQCRRMHVLMLVLMNEAGYGAAAVLLGYPRASEALRFHVHAAYCTGMSICDEDLEAYRDLMQCYGVDFSWTGDAFCHATGLDVCFSRSSEDMSWVATASQDYLIPQGLPSTHFIKQTRTLASMDPVMRHFLALSPPVPSEAPPRGAPGVGIVLPKGLHSCIVYGLATTSLSRSMADDLVRAPLVELYSALFLDPNYLGVMNLVFDPYTRSSYNSGAARDVSKHCRAMVESNYMNRRLGLGLSAYEYDCVSVAEDLHGLRNLDRDVIQVRFGKAFSPGLFVYMGIIDDCLESMSMAGSEISFGPDLELFYNYYAPGTVDFSAVEMLQHVWASRDSVLDFLHLAPERRVDVDLGGCRVQMPVCGFILQVVGMCFPQALMRTPTIHSSAPFLPRLLPYPFPKDSGVAYFSVPRLNRPLGTMSDVRVGLLDDGLFEAYNLVYTAQAQLWPGRVYTLQGEVVFYRASGTTFTRMNALPHEMDKRRRAPKYKPSQVYSFQCLDDIVRASKRLCVENRFLS